MNTRTEHGIALHTYKKCRCRAIHQIPVQIQLAFHIIIRRTGKPCRDTGLVQGTGPGGAARPAAAECQPLLHAEP